MCVCRYEEDLAFSDTQPQVLHRADVLNGEWYVSVKGDFTGRVQGEVRQGMDLGVGVCGGVDWRLVCVREG